MEILDSAQTLIPKLEKKKQQQQNIKNNNQKKKGGSGVMHLFRLHNCFLSILINQKKLLISWKQQQQKTTQQPKTIFLSYNLLLANN